MLGVLLVATVPILGILSSAVLVFITLARGPVAAVTTAAIVLGLVFVAGMIGGVAPGNAVFSLAGNWVPCVAMASLLGWTRSAALTTQLSVVAGTVFIAAFALLVPDPVVVWQPMIDFFVDAWRNTGQVEFAALIEENLPEVAKYLTFIMAVSYWLTVFLLMQLGLSIYRKLPGDKTEYGRFSELELGKVLASITAVASVGSYLIGLEWLEGAAVFLFTAFMVQGIAVVHWHKQENGLPMLTLVMAYGLFLILNFAWGAILALIGYLDAWFNLRKKITMPA